MQLVGEQHNKDRYKLLIIHAHIHISIKLHEHRYYYHGQVICEQLNMLFNIKYRKKEIVDKEI